VRAGGHRESKRKAREVFLLETSLECRKKRRNGLLLLREGGGSLERIFFIF
jgi:hypothetical protein